MTTPWHRDPFAGPHGARPQLLAPRPHLAQRVGDLGGRLAAGRFCLGLGIIGATGIGKTTVLNTIADDFTERGWLVVRVNLRPRQPLARQVSAAVRTALAERGGRDPFPKAKRRHSELRAHARIPFTPIELEYDAAANPDAATNELDVTHRVVLEYLRNGTPVVFVVDEGDFLTVEEYEDVLVPLLAEAASADWPLGVIAVGTGSRFVKVLYGESSFTASTVRNMWLRRLDDADSRRLLVDTARLGGQDWSELDLTEAVRLCGGVPRRLQAFGSTVFCDLEANGAEHALGQGLRQVEEELRELHWSLSPDLRFTHQVAVRLLGRTGCRTRLFFSALEEAMATTTAPHETHFLAEKLAECGVLQIGPEWVEVLAPIP